MGEPNLRKRKPRSWLVSNTERRLGAYLREIRNRQGQTGAAVGSHLRTAGGKPVDNSYLTRMELGNATLPSRYLEPWANALGLTIEELMRDVFAVGDWNGAGDWRNRIARPTRSLLDDIHHEDPELLDTALYRALQLVRAANL